MSELNEVESRLRSWKPRGPSPRVEQRLFAGRNEARPARPARVRWAWVAPALACGVLLLAVGRAPIVDSSHREGWGTNGLAIGTAISNQTLALLAPPSNVQHNHLSRGNFDWTNLEAFTSSTGLLQHWATNRLLAQ